MGEAAAAASHEAPRRDGRCMKRRRRPPSVNQTVGSAIGDVRYTANLQQNLANTLNNPSRPWFRSKPSAICTPSRPAAGGSPVSPSVECIVSIQQICGDLSRRAAGGGIPVTCRGPLGTLSSVRGATGTRRRGRGRLSRVRGCSPNSQ